MNPILTATNSAVAPFFAGQTSSIAQQLLQVAQADRGARADGRARQVFFVSLGGFDTHCQRARHAHDAARAALAGAEAFYDATVQLGVANQVTTFTLSDFGRTFQPASGAGTDHAWGNHHFILGGAVRGGEMYGRYPTLAAGPTTPTQRALDPTTSVEQYGATLRAGSA